MINEFDVYLQRRGETLHSIKVTISNKLPTMEKVVEQCRSLLLLGGYDSDYDGFQIRKVGETTAYYGDLIED